MHQLSVVHFVAKHASSDCGIASLAMYLDKSYEDILATAAFITKNRKVHRSGVYVTELIRIAHQYGVSLRQKRHISYNDSLTVFGILIVMYPNKNRHAVLLREGQIFDPDDYSVWDYDSFLTQGDCKPTMLLVEKC